MLRDTELSATIRRICAERSILPAETLPRIGIPRRAFQAEQLSGAIHHQWAGRYDDAQPDRRIAAWVTKHLDAPLEHAALFINGATGSGKTHSAVAALRAVVTGNLGGTYRWAAVTHPDLGDELRPRSDNSNEGALDPYLEADLLLLDDLGAGMPTAWMTDCLQRLVDRRWTRRMATIYTTNLPADVLRKAVGDRVFSRIGDATHVNLGGQDRRWTS